MRRPPPIAAKDYKPVNIGGSVCRDPREEAYARHNATSTDWIAVPRDLLLQLAAVRECDSTTVLRGDEDGPLPDPLTIRCTELHLHSGDHTNGYTSWTARRDA